ncbi:hypothetical protein VTK26DRAFT_9015 [Humicola hyalothermophila]
MDHQPEEWEKPLWQRKMEAKGREIGDRPLPVELDTLYQFIAMLHVHPDDKDAVARAAYDLGNYWREKMFPDWDDHYRNMNDQGVAYLCGAICDHAFDVVPDLKWDSVQNVRCSDLIIQLKNDAADPSNGDERNPQLPWDARNLNVHAGEQWRKLNPAYNAELEKCTEAINMHAFLARLLEGRMFPRGRPLIEGRHDAYFLSLKVVREGFLAKPNSWDLPRVSGCRAVIAAHYITLAPDQIRWAVYNYPLEREEDRDMAPPRVRSRMLAELGERRSRNVLERIRWEWGFWLGEIDRHAAEWNKFGESEEMPHLAYGLRAWQLKKSCMEARHTLLRWIEIVDVELLGAERAARRLVLVGGRQV